MVYTTLDLIKINKNYSDVMGKISRDLRDEKIIQLKRGLYESDKDTPGYYLASYIYGPSYLSFDYVLSISGLIPEGIYKTYMSATFKKNKRKHILIILEIIYIEIFQKMFSDLALKQ